jgi:hypothetical protein
LGPVLTFLLDQSFFVRFVNFVVKSAQTLAGELKLGLRMIFAVKPGAFRTPWPLRQRYT